MRETFELGEFNATITDEGSHVLSVEIGEVLTAEDMRRYLAALERFVTRTTITRVLFDARRDAPPRRGDKETREVRWDHLANRTRIVHSAVLVDSEIAQTRVNMTARAHKVSLQAFLDRPSAERWLKEQK